MRNVAAVFLLFTIINVYTPIGAMQDDKFKKDEKRIESNIYSQTTMNAILMKKEFKNLKGIDWEKLKESNNIRPWYEIDESCEFIHPLYITKITPLGAALIGEKIELVKQLLNKIGKKPNDYEEEEIHNDLMFDLTKPLCYSALLKRLVYVDELVDLCENNEIKEAVHKYLTYDVKVEIDVARKRENDQTKFTEYEQQLAKVKQLILKTETGNNLEKGLLSTMLWSFVAGVATPLPSELKNMTKKTMAYSLGIHGLGLLTSLNQAEKQLPSISSLLRNVANGGAYYTGQAAQFGFWQLVKSFGSKEAPTFLFRRQCPTAQRTVAYAVPLVVYGYLWFFKK